MTHPKKKSLLSNLGLIFILLGISCFIVKIFTPEYVDATGLLVEPYFFLLPVGYANIFIGLILKTMAFIVKMATAKR